MGEVRIIKSSMRNQTKGILCAIGCIVNVGVEAASSYLTGLFLLPISERLGPGVPFAQIVFLFSLSAIGMLIACPILGPLIKKYNPKVICAVGAASVFLHFWGMAYLPSIHLIWVTALIAGICIKSLGGLTYQVIVLEWFSEGRGTIIGLAGIVGTVISFFLVPFSAALIQKIGFQMTALYIGATLSIVGVLNSLILLSKVPAAYGMQPIAFGKDKPEKVKKVSSGEEVYESVMPVSRMLRMPFIYMVMSAVLLINIAMAMYYPTQSMILKTMGLSLRQIAVCISVYSAAVSVFSFLFGFLCDRIGAKKTIIIFCTIGAAVLFSFPLLREIGGLGAALFLVVFINVQQMGQYYSVNVIPALFGIKKTSMILGWSWGILVIPTVVISPLSASLAAVSGNYDWPLRIGAIAYLLTILITITILSNKVKDRIKEIDRLYKEKELSKGSRD